MSESERLREAIAEVLIGLRTSRQWSLREVAERSGLSIAYLSELEKGRKLPTLEALGALASAYGLSSGDLLCRLGERLGARCARCEEAPLLVGLDEDERREVALFVAFLRWKREHATERTVE